jgi:hypothetical protein
MGSALTGHAQLELLDGKLWLTAEERARVEYRAQNATFAKSTGARDDDWFLLQRARLGIGTRPVDWVQLYGELQDAREIGSYRSPNLEEDTLDWRVGWLTLGDLKTFPVQLTVGRQLLVYGEERVLGSFDWNNVGRRFDAVKLRFQPKDYPGWVDFFAANVVINDDNSFDDKADWADDFFGLYGRSERLERHALEAYAFYRDKTDAVYAGAARQIYTFGARFTTKPNMAPWDYWVEFAGQFGHVQSPGGQFGETTTAWADQLAYAGTIGVGYTFTNALWTPRVALEYAHASGDDNPTDGRSGTFDNLYPTNHKFYGFIDLVAWKNVHNPHVLVSVKPHPRVTVQLDGHLFWLVEDRDAWYRANGVAIRRDVTGRAGDFVGSEIDLTVTWRAHKHAHVLGGYSHFFSGDFVRATGAHSDAMFFYTQVTLKL